MAQVFLSSKSIHSPGGAFMIRKALLKSGRLFWFQTRKLLVVMLPNERLAEQTVAWLTHIIGVEEENIIFSEDWTPSISYENVYVASGNPYEMLQYMRNKGLVNEIQDSMSENYLSMYIGTGAGAMIAAASIENAIGDCNYVGMKEYASLCLLGPSTVVFPHSTTEDMERYQLMEDFRGIFDKYETVIPVSNKEVVVIKTKENRIDASLDRIKIE